MDPSSLLGVATWLADRVAGSILGRPRLRFSIRSEGRGAWFDIGSHVSPPSPSVVVRAANGGRVPVEIETIGFELDDGELVALEGGDELPTVVAAPGHVERDESRKAMANRIGSRQLKQIVAIGTDGRRYRGATPQQWRSTATWPQ